MKMHETFLKPMHPEGRRFVALFAALTLGLFLLWEPLGWIGLGLTVWCYYFFRDPERVTPARPGVIVSPADGIVSLIEPAVPPAELGLPDAPLTRVSVFMSVFNCHVNRAPVAGVVKTVAYRPGKFLNASLDKASADNERNGIVIEMADGRVLPVVQIAGLVARRILLESAVGDELAIGQQFGIIRFGSRVDLWLPADTPVLVLAGQRTVAGETVLADRSGTISEPTTARQQ
mgnify:CR=1 FL=1